MSKAGERLIRSAKQARMAVVQGCGCVFCDLGLDPDSAINGRPVHMTSDRLTGYSFCTRDDRPSRRHPMTKVEEWHSDKSNDRVTFPDGKLDEVVGSRGAHLEHLGGPHWFLSITHDDGRTTAMWFKSASLGKRMEKWNPSP